MTSLNAGQYDTLTRYKRAEHLLKGMYTNEVVRNDCIFPVWSSNSSFFVYSRDVPDGYEYRLVNVENGTNETAFDHEAFATALSDASGVAAKAQTLPVKAVTYKPEAGVFAFTAFGKSWIFDVDEAICRERDEKPTNWVVSPDGAYAVYQEDNNLWLSELETDEKRQLTFDGEDDYVYGACGEAWGAKMAGAETQVRWSPDSKKIVTVQRDQRQVKTLPILHYVPANGDIRPKVDYRKIAYPGDPHVEEYRILAINIENGSIVDAEHGRIPTMRNCQGFFKAHLGWWGRDSRRAYFVDVDRYYKTAKVFEFDTDTGAARLLFEETSETQINLMLNSDMAPALVPMPETDELIWFSERSGWAHYYLYDLNTGEVKTEITSGEWLVREIVRIIPEKREVILQTAGREPGRDPYYRDLVRVNFDTGELSPIISSDHDYFASAPNDLQRDLAGCLSGGLAAVANGAGPSGDHFVVTRTRADEISESFLLDREGEITLELEKGDVSKLPDDWRWPEPVALQAADGTTDLYGLVYRPSDFSPDLAYPVISHVFNTPELPWVPKGAFLNDGKMGMAYLDAAALAELGFIVVQIDARGTPFREKAFLDESYGWLESAGNIADHVAGLKQLAERFPYIDLDRVGITTQGAGSPGAIAGLLDFPEFYKVGVQSLLHDSRMFGAAMWGDKYEGPDGPRDGRQYPEDRVYRLQGKLMLQHGLLDEGCPAAATMRLVEALQKANKDFDLVLMPNFGHLISSYQTRRGWDFLVRHLQGVEPPETFKLTSGFDLMAQKAQAAASLAVDRESAD